MSKREGRDRERKGKRKAEKAVKERKRERERLIYASFDDLAAYEQAVREQKMRTEISQAKRENTHYLASVEKGKEIDAIVERKRKRGATEEEVSNIQCSPTHTTNIHNSIIIQGSAYNG